jgi:putative exosortase-associated protein (TIGR04073 family)
MKKFVIALGCMFLLSFSASVEAAGDDPPSGHNALRKLGRGLANILFGFTEVPNQYSKTQANHSGAAAVTYGLGKGIGRWFWRECIGVYEVVTFPFPAPAGYKPIMAPEFPLEDIEP